jgi:hypothetical protein
MVPEVAFTRFSFFACCVTYILSWRMDTRNSHIGTSRQLFPEGDALTVPFGMAPSRFAHLPWQAGLFLQNIVRFDASEETRPRYLEPLVRTEWFWSKLASATRGVGARRERTRPEQFLRIELPMPDIERQAHGEALWRELHDTAHLQSETAAELDALLPAILDRAFKDEL